MWATIELDDIETLRDKLREATRERDEEAERASALESDLGDAENEIEKLEARVEELEAKHNLARLADVRKAILSNRPEDAVYDLEKVLDDMDEGSRTWWCL